MGLLPSFGQPRSVENALSSLTEDDFKPRALPVPDSHVYEATFIEPEARRAAEQPQGTPPQEDYKDLPVISIGGWTVDRIRAALASMQIGQFQQAAMLTEAMLGDDCVQTALNGRIKGVTMRHVHAVPAERDTEGKYRDWALWMWREVFTDELLDQLMTWTTNMGFSLFEVCWDTTTRNGQEVWVPYLKPWHPSYIWYDITVRQYVAVTEEGPIWIDPEDPKWWTFTPWGSYRGWIRGSLRGCAPLWIIRQYAVRDWARFSEVHGLPIKLVKAPAQSDARDKQRMFSQVSNLGASSTVLLPQQTGDTGWLLELLEAKDRAWEAFPGLADYCDRRIHLNLRGTNLTSEVQGGSYAAAQVHADEDSAYADSDCRKLCEAARRLVEMFLAFNFGEGELCPDLYLQPPDKQDKLALAQTQQFVLTMAKQAKELGWELDAKMLAEQYNIPLIGVSVEDVKVNIPLAPTDIAKTVRVHESRKSIGLGPLGDERDNLLIAELEKPGVADQNADDQDDSDAP